MRGACFKLFEPRLLDCFDLLADEVQPCLVAAQLGDCVRRQGLVFRAAQRHEKVTRLAQLDFEVANAKPDQRRLHPVHNTGLLLY